MKTLADMVGRYGLVTGLSDHTLDNTAAISSVALGGSIIEKHFTLDREGGGPDDSFSMEPRDLKNLVDSVATAHQCLGEVDYGLKSSEVGNIKFRRSLYFIKDLKAGELITEDAVKSIRPGYGVAPKYLDSVIGSVVKKDVGFGHAVTEDVLEIKLR
jgi:N-acetylneuraminate synthase